MVFDENIVDYLNFEKYILKSKGIDLDKLIIGLGNFEKVNSFNKKELQAFFETVPLLIVLKYQLEDLNKLSYILQNIDNKYIIKIENILKKQSQNFYPLINVEKVVFKLISSFILQTFNNNLLLAFKEDKLIWYNIHDIFTEFYNILNNFYTFFNDDNSYPITNLEKKTSRDFTFLVIKLCEKNDIFLKKEEYYGKKKIIFYSLKSTTINNNIYLNIKVFFLKPSIVINKNNSFLIGIHYRSVIKVFRENFKSNKFFILGNNDTIEKLTELKFYLNKNMYYTFYSELVIENKLDKNNIFNSILDKYLESNKKIYLKYHQKLNSKYYILLAFFYLENFNLLFTEYFFLGFFFDFRGRIYYDSLISPTGNKIFRLLYTYGSYDHNELSNFYFNSYDSDTHILNYILENSYLKLIFSELDLTKSYINEIIKQCFFELGKIFKSEFINEYKGVLCFFDFIKIGVKIFNNFFDNIYIPFEKKIEVLYIINILIDYNKKNFVKYILYKDATASSIQLLIIILNTNNKNNFKICNLLNDGFWYDTYYFIITDFLKHYNSQINFKNILFFNRKTLKKTIMTYNYSATVNTCFWDFFNNIATDFENKCLIKTEIEKDFKLFFNYLTKMFDSDIFFKKPSKSLLDDFKKNLDLNHQWEVKTLDESKVFFIYYFIKINRLDKIIDNQRYTFVLYEPSINFDKLKTLQSFRANLIHSLDATYVRLILKRLPYGIITIHDCFGIDILNVNLLLCAANKSIREIYEKDDLIFNSNFILL